jgi:hypothetical protein
LCNVFTLHTTLLEKLIIFINIGCKQYSPKHKSITFETGSNVCHGAASRGDLDLIQQIAEENEDMIYAKDGNGWQPLHEVRSHQCCPVYFVILNCTCLSY